MVSGNIPNSVYPLDLPESSNKTSESNGSAEEFASASDKGTLPKSTSASNSLIIVGNIEYNFMYMIDCNNHYIYKYHFS
jgi:hypothetical protein